MTRYSALNEWAGRVDIITYMTRYSALNETSSACVLSYAFHHESQTCTIQLYDGGGFFFSLAQII